MKKTFMVVSAMLIAGLQTAVAKEGMFTPEQLPLIKKDLKATGLKISPESLSSLTGFPMGAVVVMVK